MHLPLRYFDVLRKYHNEGSMRWDIPPELVFAWGKFCNLKITTHRSFRVKWSGNQLPIEQIIEFNWTEHNWTELNWMQRTKFKVLFIGILTVMIMFIDREHCGQCFRLTCNFLCDAKSAPASRLYESSTFFQTLGFCVCLIHKIYQSNLQFWIHEDTEGKEALGTWFTIKYLMSWH